MVKSTGTRREGRALLLGIAGVLIGVVCSLAVWVLRGDGRGPLEVPGEERVEVRSAGELPYEGLSAEETDESVDESADEGARVALETVPIVDLANQPPRPWKGHVQDRGTGAPIGGATVGLRWERLLVETESDEEGAFELTWRGPDRSDAHVTCPGFAPLFRPQVEVGEPAVFQLESAGVIAGRVIGPSPDELDSGVVSLWNLATDRGARRRPVEGEIGEDGGFEFEGLAEAEYAVAVSIPGWSLVFESAILVEPGERVMVLLEPVLGATLHGTVRTAARNTPVAGATVLVEPERQGVSGAVEDLGKLEGVTEDDGSFTLLGLSVGRNDLTVETSWGGRATRQIPVADAGERIGPIEILIMEPASLGGRVVDESGNGIAHARVQAAWTGSAFSTDPGRSAVDHEGLLRADADVNGRFRFEMLPPGRKIDLVAFRGEGEAPPPVLLAKQLGFHPALTLDAGERREGFELCVYRPLTRRGVVIDPEGAPIEGVRVSLQRSVRGSAARWGEERTDDEGRFELVGLLPGPHRVQLRHSDFLSSFERITITPGVESLIELVLDPAYRITGWVVDEWGNAIPAARVSAERFDSQQGRVRRARGVRSGCDDYGRFELDPLAAGEWRVRADAVGHESTTLEPVLVPGAEGLELVLRRQTPLERVTLTGQAIQPDGRSPKSLRVDNTRGGAMTQEGVRFRLSGVRPGNSRFTFSANGCAPVRVGPLDLLPGAEVDLGVIELPFAVQVNVYVRAKGGKSLERLKARLLPLPAAEGGYGSKTINLGTRRTKHTWSGESSRKTVYSGSSPAVPVGRWRLLVDHSGYDRYEKTVTLGAENRRRNFEVELAPKGSKKKEKKRGKKKGQG